MRKFSSIDYCGILQKEDKRKTFTYVDQHSGTCGKWIDGVRCGKPFTGPKTRRFCDEHSIRVRLGGKG